MHAALVFTARCRCLSLSPVSSSTALIAFQKRQKGGNNYGAPTIAGEKFSRTEHSVMFINTLSSC